MNQGAADPLPAELLEDLHTVDPRNSGSSKEGGRADMLVDMAGREEPNLARLQVGCQGQSTMEVTAAIGGERLEPGRFLQLLDPAPIRNHRRGWEGTQAAYHASAMDHAMKTLRAEMPAQICGFRGRTDDPVTGNFFPQMSGENLFDAPISISGREPRPGHRVSRPGISGEAPQDIPIVIKLHPGKMAVHAKHFGLV